MWVDLFVCAPVTLFMLWLYLYSTPAERPSWMRSVDGVLLLLAPLSVIAILVIGHSLIDFEGMGLNVMLVAAAYLMLIALLGAGWMLRFRYLKIDQSSHRD